MEWHEGIDSLRPHIVHISTPNGSGTGWLVSISSLTGLCAIATAAHVVDHAHYWEMPIRLYHPESGKSILLHPDERSIHIETNLDTAAIVFDKGELGFPDETLPLIKKGYFLRQGVEIGWLGFPAIHQSDVCFFSGRISNYIENSNRYLVDGVAINGVSGGPSFRVCHKNVELIGVVSAYIANRATGETLPGLGVIQDVSQFHDITERFKSIDEARSEEAVPEEPSEASSPSEGGDSGESQKT